jgi:hypothetical protein
LPPHERQRANSRYQQQGPGLPHSRRDDGCGEEERREYHRDGLIHAEDSKIDGRGRHGNHPVLNRDAKPPRWRGH